MDKLVVIFGLVLFVSCQSGNNNNDKKPGKIESEIILAEDTVNISGMHCDMCVASIEKGIKELSGINYVKADLSDSIAVVRFDPSKTSLAEIEDAVEQRGYKVKSN